jgi:hypothetical protein
MLMRASSFRDRKLFATLMQKYSDCRIGVKSFFHETLTGFHGHSPHGSAVASSLPRSPHRVHYQPPRKLSDE